jgi:MazG family protein
MKTPNLSPNIGNELQQVCELMQTLRAPGGCSWDRKQTLSSLKRYLIEETYETIDAIEELEANPSEHAQREHLEELGDLLLQIIFQSEIQRQAGIFDMGDVCRVLGEKLKRRHPHIFGDDPNFDSDSNPHWERIKAEERTKKGVSRESIFDGIPNSLPAIHRAAQLDRKMAEVGFDWPDYEGALKSLKEEVIELDEVIHSEDLPHIEHELGDIMLACVSIAHHKKLDPEVTMKKAGRRVENRFRHIEAAIKAEGKELKGTSPEEFTRRWKEAKKDVD